MTTHHFTMSRKAAKKRSPRENLDIAVTIERRGLKHITQNVVAEIADHVRKIEADPVYGQPAQFNRYAKKGV